MPPNSFNQTPEVSGYQVFNKLGSGSYSVVYKAQNNETNEYVAIKCVDRYKLSNLGRDNIVSEITIMKMLKHRFIVEMLDFQYDDRYIYLILEYCDKGDLSNFIKRRRKLPEKICKRFMQHLTLGIQFLRSKDICHLDLKPQNLLLKSFPTLTLKLGDFGLSRFLSEETHADSVRGSPLYMAPEMLLGQGYDARADLWSVGVILFECLFGKAPLSHSSCKQLITIISDQTPLEIPSELSKEARDLLTRLLRYDPNQRITFEQLYEHPFIDLEHFPNEVSYQKATIAAKEAVMADYNKRYLDAFKHYCAVLHYLVPFLSEDVTPKKKCLIRSKIDEYLKRAEQLKVNLYKTKEHLSTVRTERMQKTEKDEYSEDKREIAESNSLAGIVSDIKSIALDNDATVALINLAKSTPKLMDALDIGFSAQMYLYEGNCSLALEKFKSCLGLLIPLLSEEPNGNRKVLLTKQVEEWLKQAESADALVKAKADPNEDNEVLEDACFIQ